MKKTNLIILVSIALTGCYVSREHREWSNREKKGLNENHFYQVLQDTAVISDSIIKFGIPYVCVDVNGFYHAYTFDKEKCVYSHPWINDNPEYLKIVKQQTKIGTTPRMEEVVLLLCWLT